MLWGGLTKSPARPDLAGVPVYPNAQALVNLSPKQPGLSNATPGTSVESARDWTNFSYETADSPDAVLKYYHSVLDKMGFYFYPEGEQTPQSISGSFTRQSDTRNVERLRLTALVNETGRNKVTVEFQVLDRIP
jgi:hypothetical protein